VLAGPLDHLDARDRCAGFSEALNELGCPPPRPTRLSARRSPGMADTRGCACCCATVPQWRSSLRSTT
jgi:hypothetical protein